MRRSYLKFIGIALGIVLLCAVAAGGVLFALLENFYPSPPQTHYAKPLDPLEAQRQDIDYFGKLIAMDRSYSPTSRAEANHRLAALSNAKTVLPRPYFRVALMKIAALADNGHTHVGIDSGAEPMELPARVAAFSDGIYVMHATKQYGDLLGGKLVSIDGYPIDVVMGRLEQLRGGTAQWRKLYAEIYISWLDMLVGIGIAPDMSHSTWTVTAPSGATVTHTLTPYLPGKNEPFIFVKRNYSDAPLKQLGRDWNAYQPSRPLPVTFTDFDTTFRQFRLPHSCVMVIQLKSAKMKARITSKGFSPRPVQICGRTSPASLFLTIASTMAATTPTL